LTRLLAALAAATSPTFLLQQVLNGVLNGSIPLSDVSPYIGRDQVELKGLAVIVVSGGGLDHRRAGGGLRIRGVSLLEVDHLAVGYGVIEAVRDGGLRVEEEDHL
jgi:hypothetical protein